MPDPTVPPDLIADLLRSAWVVERARSLVYEAWADSDPGSAAKAEWATERADSIAGPLVRMGRSTDPDLVERHAAWMSGIVGAHPEEVALGPLFLARLGNWTESHVARFMDEAESAGFEELGERERSELTFPASMPPVPDFEPLDEVAVDQPDDVVLRVGILGDTHFGSPHAEERVGAAIDDLNESGVDVVIQMGDITDKGEKEEFEAAAASLSRIEIPLVTMMGNHDVWSKSEGRLTGIEYYPAHFGRAPDGLIVEREGIKLVVLDSVEHGASPFGPFDMVSGTFTDGARGAIVRGALSHAQHDLLAEIAGPGGGPALIFLHHPPQPFTSFPPIVFGLREEDSGRLHAVVDSGNVWGIFAGHTHRCAAPWDLEGIPVREVGVPRDFPFGYGLLDISLSGYTYRFKQLSDRALLEGAYQEASEIHRRYGAGPESARGFTWEKPG